mmetsp:Transcript_14871/g.32402  ORF Transcript_14871/g.32402 Transcript_14871/m.32402 type:complete len:256 (-) Transcript_14871:7525-8292(-)
MTKHPSRSIGGPSPSVRGRTELRPGLCHLTFSHTREPIQTSSWPVHPSSDCQSTTWSCDRERVRGADASTSSTPQYLKNSSGNTLAFSTPCRTATSSSSILCTYFEHTGKAARSAQTLRPTVDCNRPKYRESVGVNAFSKIDGSRLNMEAAVNADTMRNGSDADNKPILQAWKRSISSFRKSVGDNLVELKSIPLKSETNLASGWTGADASSRRAADSPSSSLATFILMSGSSIPARMRTDLLTEATTILRNSLD